MAESAAEARLLIYSQDGLGLGHMRRTTLLATEFLRSRVPASTLTISDSPLGQFFSPAGGHDYLKLPCIRKTGPGLWHPVALSSPIDDVLALRRELIRSAMVNFRPDVFLVDHMPTGAMGELVPALEAARSRPVRVVLGLRDILDAPETVRRRWRLEGAFETIERHYDDVLVYGSREVYDVAAEYDWPAATAQRVRYCGYVCATESSEDHAEVRERYLDGAPTDSSLVVAMAGGGADAYPLFDALLRSLPKLLVDRPCVVVLVTGPFLPEEERCRLAARARDLPVHILPAVGDSLSYIGAADLVIAMAGYNTTVEILSQNKPALLVPRSGPSAEQQLRARLFAERGWVHWLPPDELAGEALGAAAARILAGESPTADYPPDLRGREVAAQRLLAGLHQVKPRSEARVVAPVPASVGDPQLLVDG